MTGAAPPCPQPDETQGMPAKETQCLAENCPRSPWTVVGTGSGLSIQTRAEITSRYARAYAKASKKDKRRGSLTRSGSRGLEPGQRPQRGGRPALRRDGQTDAFLRIAFALRSSRFSASSSPIRSASSPVVPGRVPPSISACPTQMRRASGQTLGSSAILRIAPPNLSGCRRTSTAIRAAHPLSSSGYFPRRTPDSESSVHSPPPRNPGRFTAMACRRNKEQSTHGVASERS